MKNLTYLLQTFAVALMGCAALLFYLRIERNEYIAGLILGILFFANFSLFIWQWKIRKSITARGDFL